MPRGLNITPAQRQEWLEQYEQGATVITLAKRENKDVRTVKAQLQRAADERELIVARRDLIRDTLKDHNEDLKAAALRIQGALQVMHDERITPLSSFPSANGVDRLALLFDVTATQFRQIDQRSDSRSIKFEALLREHLRSERSLWQGIDKWNARHGKYQWALYQLGDEIAQQIGANTGLEPVESSRNADGFTEHFVSWAVRLAIESWRNDRAKPKIELPTGRGSLVFGGSTLARSESIEKLELGKQKFIDQVDTMRRSREVRLIAEEQAWLEWQTDKLRDKLENLLLFGLIPGKCSACRRYAI